MWGFFLRQKKGSCQRDACAACLIEAIGEHAVFRSAFDRSDITAVAERTLVTALVGVEALQGVSLVDGNAGGPRHVGPGCAAVRLAIASTRIPLAASSALAASARSRSP